MRPRREHRHREHLRRTRRHGFARHERRRLREDMLTLDMVPSGRRARVVRVHGGRRLVHRLATLGLVPGSVVTVTRSRGPAIVLVRGTRMVVGRGAAMAIEMEEADE